MATVRSVARRPLAPAHAKLVHTQADLREDAAREALAGVDVLFHLGFALWRGRDTAHVNWDGTRNILAARPARVVLASSAAVYGAWPDNPLPMREDHWPRPNRQCAYATDKLRAERLCESAAPTLALRIGAVLGPHTDPQVAQAVKGYRLVVPAFMGKNEALQFLDEADAAAALHQAGASTATGLLNIAPADWLNAQGVAKVANSHVLRMPTRLLLAGSEVAFRLHQTPFGADRAILINGPLALDPAKAGRVLGWKAKKSTAEVLAAALSD
ncbi:MAG: UDP-glucose 4-epimerase [Acidimicrobiaceae bacterium]|nr:UDP-glucose 4-epimerase [Acidimicrobiaceae bacterium]